MKSMNVVRKYGRKTGAAVAIALTASAPVFAAIDEGISTALSDAKADVLTIGGLALVVIVAAAAFKYMRRAL